MKDSLRGVEIVRGDGFTFAAPLPKDFLPGVVGTNTRWSIRKLPNGDLAAGLTDSALADLCAELLGDRTGTSLGTRMGELVMLLAGDDRWNEAVWVAASMAARTNGN